MTTTTKASKATKRNSGENNAATQSEAARFDTSFNFEDALNELEDITQQMQQGQLGLNDMMTLYKRGMILSAECQSALENAQQEVLILEQSAQENAISSLKAT